MFFYPAKLLWFVAQPSSAIAIVMIVGVVLAGTSKQLGKLVAKLRMQGWALDKEKHTEYKALADEIEAVYKKEN